MISLFEMLSGRPTVSLVIHRSQLLWRVSSLDSWFLDKAHDSAAPCRRTDKTMAEQTLIFTLNETFLEVKTILLLLLLMIMIIGTINELLLLLLLQRNTVMIIMSQQVITIMAGVRQAG